MVSRLSQTNNSGIIYAQELLASIYRGMGFAYLQCRQFKKASNLLNKALEIELHILPSDHPELIESYHTIACMNFTLEQYVKALQNYEEAMRIAEKNLLTNDWRYIFFHLNAAILIYYTDRNTSKILMHCSHASRLLDQSPFSVTSSNRLEVYRILASLYMHSGFVITAVQVWEKFIKAGTNRLIATLVTTDFSGLLMPMNTMNICNQNSTKVLNYMIFANSRSSIASSVSLLEIITRCEISDQWRAMGYIEQAIVYYTWLLERLPKLETPENSRLHKSRLHNNLGASYQDLNDDQMALYHCQLALDTLGPNDEHKTMQAAIIHYNIALILKNCERFDEARTHLHKSLIHFSGSPQHQNSILDVQIYVAFAKIHEKCNEWYKARDYYQRIVDQIREDAPNHPARVRYEKRLQHSIEKINESTSNGYF